MDKLHKLDILLPAQVELEEIARVHMALSGPNSARSITNQIYDAMEQLARFPLYGPLIRDEALKAGKYLVIYRLLGDVVVVYHIADGRTDYPKLFKTRFF